MMPLSAASHGISRVSRGRFRTRHNRRARSRAALDGGIAVPVRAEVVRRSYLQLEAQIGCCRPFLQALPQGQTLQSYQHETHTRQRRALLCPRSVFDSGTTWQTCPILRTLRLARDQYLVSIFDPPPFNISRGSGLRLGTALWNQNPPPAG